MRGLRTGVPRSSNTLAQGASFTDQHGALQMSSTSVIIYGIHTDDRLFALFLADASGHKQRVQRSCVNSRNVPS
jgi:hypothetical protein